MADVDETYVNPAPEPKTTVQRKRIRKHVTKVATETESVSLPLKAGHILTCLMSAVKTEWWSLSHFMNVFLLFV